MHNKYIFKIQGNGRMPGKPCHVSAAVRERFQIEREAGAILDFLEDKCDGWVTVYPTVKFKGVYLVRISPENGAKLSPPKYFIRIEPDLSYLGMWEYESGEWIGGALLK